ncbi:MAG: DUF2182 domain-containing protein [Micropruina sp.]|uniref:copper chaperone n=1 Tax=Micropruina sp. TaxID=2737536 RepID=UPI0039E36219
MTSPPAGPSPVETSLVEPSLVEPVETPPVEPVETPLVEPVETPLVELVETPRAPTASIRTPSVEPVETHALRGRQIRMWPSQHPEWLALLLASASWVWLAVALGWFTSGSGWGLPGHHHGVEGGDAPHSTDGQLLIWVAMVFAMMVPTTIPHLRYLGFNTRTSRRQRSIALFLLGYVVVWLAPGFALSLIGSPAPWVVAVVVLAAGAWELTAVKRRALRRCCRTWPVGYAGASADSAAVEYGLRHGVTCLLVGGPAMVALTLAGHPAWATVALAALMAAQKLLSRPDRWRTVVAIGWLASGVAVAGAVFVR